VIAGLFPQSRSLFVIGFAGWLGLCVYVGGLLDGNRAYSGILSGYTVALVAVTQIDSPQNIFSAGVNRGAAIVVGIAALALISDVFAAPNVHTGLSGKLIAAHRRVRAFALAIVRGERADPIQSANLLREITALHPDITALVAESSSGWARAAAARSAAVALVAEVSAAGALASLPAKTWLDQPPLAPTAREHQRRALRHCRGATEHEGAESRAYHQYLLRSRLYDLSCYGGLFGDQTSGARDLRGAPPGSEALQHPDNGHFTRRSRHRTAERREGAGNRRERPENL
jgi:Fusaric acid resistance protein family